MLCQYMFTVMAASPVGSQMELMGSSCLQKCVFQAETWESVRGGGRKKQIPRDRKDIVFSMMFLETFCLLLILKICHSLNSYQGGKSK